MALAEGEQHTTTRTTLENPTWGKPAADAWPAPEAYNRSCSLQGQSQAALTNLQEKTGPANKGLTKWPPGVILEVLQTLVDFDLERGRYPNRPPVPLGDKA